MFTSIKRKFFAGLNKKTITKNCNNEEISPQENITESQINQISECFYQRHNKFNNGELYKIDDYAPNDLEGFLQLETWLILIGLDECLIERSVAVSALQGIIFNMLNKIGGNIDINKKEDIDTSIPEALLDELEKLQGGKIIGGWLEYPVTFAINRFYKNEEKTRERTAFIMSQLMNDTFEGYYNVMKAFKQDICN